MISTTDSTAVPPRECDPLPYVIRLAYVGAEFLSVRTGPFRPSNPLQTLPCNEMLQTMQFDHYVDKSDLSMESNFLRLWVRSAHLIAAAQCYLRTAIGRLDGEQRSCLSSGVRMCSSLRVALRYEPLLYSPINLRIQREIRTATPIESPLCLS